MMPLPADPSAPSLTPQHVQLTWDAGEHTADARRIVLALAPAVIVLAGLLIGGPIAQPQAYHHFHDARPLLGIPNFLNVVSNLPFALAGMAGLFWLRAGRHELPAQLAACYGLMMAGMTLTALGSAYYHWAPSHGTLVWDRLPMAIAFMGLFAGFLTERLRLSAPTSLRLRAGLLAFGLASVLTWAAFDDLRLYVLAQFYPLLAIPVILWRTPAPFTRGGDWLVALAIYVAAKLLEEMDGLIFLTGGVVSGHTLKHLAAAAGAFWIVRMLMRRRVVAGY